MSGYIPPLSRNEFNRNEFKSENNVRNLAYYAATETETREYNPDKGFLPKPISVGASMALLPEYFVASGYLGSDSSEKVHEFYSVGEYGVDSARLAFQQKYYAAGLRGVTIKPLYDLNRFH